MGVLATALFMGGRSARSSTSGVVLLAAAQRCTTKAPRKCSSGYTSLLCVTPLTIHQIHRRRVETYVSISPMLYVAVVLFVLSLIASILFVESGEVGPKTV